VRFWRLLTWIAAIWTIGGALTVLAIAPSYARMISKMTAPERVDSESGLVYRVFDEREERENQRAFSIGGVLFFLVSGVTAFAVGSIFARRIQRADREAGRSSSPGMAAKP
jgi:hypothetical protein